MARKKKKKKKQLRKRSLKKLLIKARNPKKAARAGLRLRLTLCP